MKKSFKLSVIAATLTLLISPLQVIAATPANVASINPSNALSQGATLNGDIPGVPFGDAFGQVVYFHKDKLFVTAMLARPTPTKSTEGAVYVFQKVNGVWVKIQTLITDGTSDHFGAVGIRALDDWLFISGIGTPIGPIANDILANQNFQGSVQIYRFNHTTNQYQFFEALDVNTPGLSGLSSCDPSVVSGSPPPVSTVEQGAAFGLNFDILQDEKILLVGAATQQNGAAINSGELFAFKFQAGHWTLVQTLLNPDGISANDTFGGVIRASGKYVAVSNSALFTDSHVGSAPNTNVYLFKYNTHTAQLEYVHKVHGTQTNKTPYNAPSLGATTISDNFGATMSFDKGYLVVGAPFENLGSNSPLGAAYIFKLTNTGSGKQLVQQAKFLPTDPTSYFFGMSVGIHGKHAYIGDPVHTGPAPSNNRAQGAVVVFKRHHSTWNYDTTLFDTNGVAYDLLGGGIGDGKKIVGIGTAKPVTLLFLQFFPSPALLSVPFPLQLDKVVLWNK